MGQTPNNIHPILSEDILQDMESLQMPDEPDILVEIFETFIKSSPDRLEKIKTVSKTDDLKAISREAHALKSSARTIGAVRLGEACQRLEHQPDLVKVSDEVIKDIEVEVAVVIAEMKKIRPALA
jgi:HPt (histidine-containing phosphotransfer) domain-containing protein